VDCFNGDIFVKDISGLARFPRIYHVQLREHIREDDCLGGRHCVRKAMPNVFPGDFLVMSVFTIAGKVGGTQSIQSLPRKPGLSTLLATYPDRWTVFIITIDRPGRYLPCLSYYVSTLNLAENSEQQIASRCCCHLEEAHQCHHLSCGYQGIVEGRGLILLVHEY